MKRKRQIRALLMAIVLLSMLIITNCRPSYLVVEDILPSAHYKNMNAEFIQHDFSNYDLNLELIYSFKNPYKKALPIPEHTVGLELNGSPFDGVYVHLDTEIPPKSELDLHYPITLSSNSLQDFLGKDNELLFLAEMEIDLSEFASMLPNYNVSVTDNFTIDSSHYIPLVQNLIKKNVDTWEISLEKQAKIKIPALPEILPSNKPIVVHWLGDGNKILNLNDIKDGMLELGYELLDGDYDLFGFDLVDKILENEIIAGAFEAFLEGAKGICPSAKSDWEKMIQMLNPSGNNDFTVFILKRFYEVGSNADEIWDGFVDGYNDIKDIKSILPSSIPSLKTEGFSISFPVKFINTNEFPVKIPLFANNAMMNGNRRFSILLCTEYQIENRGEIPVINTEEIPNNHTEVEGNETITLYISFVVDWKDTLEGISDFLTKDHALQPNVKGIFSFDFGYNPLYVNYDLAEQELEFTREE